MKGQIAVEFSIMVMLAFVFLGVVLIISLFYLERAHDQRLQRGVEDVADQAQQELLLAAAVEDGYTRTFTLPDTIDGSSYDLSNTATTLTIEADDVIYNRDIPNVTGSLGKGTNTVRRIDGAIIIS